jgi:hypothetical protein
MMRVTRQSQQASTLARGCAAFPLACLVVDRITKNPGAGQG